MKHAIVSLIVAVFLLPPASTAESVPVWGKFERSFASGKIYDNPLYDVSRFTVTFTAPSGRHIERSGFWNGDLEWRVRFMPDERGTWTFATSCSDEKNSGLNGISGTFDCVLTESPHAVFKRGCIGRASGAFHLIYADGTPFFWLGDTAWNGPLKSTDDEWEEYLSDRESKGFTVIQFATTQWRGCASDSEGRTAFKGSGRIAIDPEFFKHLDGKIDRINAHGLVAAPVILWALPYGAGRELSPGYYLPDNEAILLARYMVARYGANHVIWMLGGDGKFIDDFEQRWKNIGRGVFGSRNHPGLVTLHPMGLSWYGNVYDDEDWLDIVGYQSSHSIRQDTIDWINKGPAANEWDKIPPRPIINLEPIYENIIPNATERDVRNACWWSLFATPAAGVSYGANGMWSWLREGEQILNHRHNPNTKPWHESLALPGAAEAGYIAGFMKRFDWTRLRPAPGLLASQPGTENFTNFISVLSTDTRDLILVYFPHKIKADIYNTDGLDYAARWFDTKQNTFTKADITSEKGHISAEPPVEGDFVLVLEKR